jgi:hypothetical protein
MQTKMKRTVVLFIGALVLTLNLPAQQANPISHGAHFTETNAAIVFNVERAQVAQAGSPSFWLKGGAMDASTTVWKGLGIAANLTGEHAANVSGNVSLGKFAYMFGPRYTFHAPRYRGSMTEKRGAEIFGEALFGDVHAFDSTFPGTNSVQTSANGFSMQMGGGVDIHLAKGLGLRALEVDWLHTNLPNNASNTQNDLRLAFGMSWRWQR